MKGLISEIQKRMAGIAFLLALACLFLHGFASQSHAVGSCTPGMSSIIGTEFVAKSCAPEGANDNTSYDYFVTENIQCTNGTVVISSLGNQSTRRYNPASIMAAYGSSSYFKTLRNEDGTHFIIVHRYFTGTLEGESMNLPRATVYYDKINRTYFPPAEVPDTDGDGYTVCEDCDDTNAAVHENCGPSLAEAEAEQLKDPVTCGKKKVDSFAGIDTGEYFHSQDLFSFSGPPLSASLELSYRTLGRAGTVGQGWRHSYDIGLRGDGSGNLVARIGSNDRLYTYNNGTYVSEKDDYSTLIVNDDGTYALTEKNGLAYDFNSSGKCTAITDRNGNQNVLAYNGNGLLETVTDSAGRVLTFAYNTGGTLASVTDPKGSAFNFGYTSGLLTAVTHPDGSGWSYTYDADGYLLTKTDPENYTVTNTLDTNHRITQSVDPNSRTRLLDYPTDTSTTVRSTTFTEKDGNDWTYTYDTAAKVLLSKTDPEGFTTSYTWDSNKNLLSKTEPGNVVTSYTYDTSGNVLTVTDALSRVTTFTYNSFGQILTAVGPRGTIENTYDGDGNLLQVENYDDTVDALTQFTYNSQGQVTKITDALTRETDFVYDTNGLLTSVTPPSGVGTILWAK